MKSKRESFQVQPHTLCVFWVIFLSEILCCNITKRAVSLILRMKEENKFIVSPTRVVFLSSNEQHHKLKKMLCQAELTSQKVFALNLASILFEAAVSWSRIFAISTSIESILSRKIDYWESFALHRLNNWMISCMRTFIRHFIFPSFQHKSNAINQDRLEFLLFNWRNFNLTFFFFFHLCVQFSNVFVDGSPKCDSFVIYQRFTEREKQLEISSMSNRFQFHTF